jgi:hypothetical protein
LKEGKKEEERKRTPLPLETKWGQIEHDVAKFASVY